MKKILLILAFSLMCIGINAQNPDWMTCHSYVFNNHLSLDENSQHVKVFNNGDVVVSAAKDIQGNCFIEAITNTANTSRKIFISFDTIYSIDILDDIVYFSAERTTNHYCVIGYFSITNLLSPSPANNVSVNIINLGGTRLDKIRVYRDNNQIYHIAGLQRNTNGGTFIDITYNTITPNTIIGLNTTTYSAINSSCNLQDIDLTDNYVALTASDKNSEKKFYIGKYNKDGSSAPDIYEYQPSANVHILYNESMLIRNTFHDDVVVVTGGADINYSPSILLYICRLTSMAPAREQSIHTHIKSYKFRDAVYFQNNASVYILKDDRDLTDHRFRIGKIIQTDPYSAQTFGNTAYLWQLLNNDDVIYNSIAKLGSDRFIAYGYHRHFAPIECYLVKDLSMQTGTCVDYTTAQTTELPYTGPSSTQPPTILQPPNISMQQISVPVLQNNIIVNCFN